MKRCSNCRKNKELEEFYKSSKQADGRQSYCKQCNTLWGRTCYLKNKSHYVAKYADVRRRNREYVIAYLKQHPCVDCNEEDIVVLDFDHLSDKFKNISVLLGSGYSLATIEKEIAKCQVRCANCHRRRTAKQFGWNKSSIGSIPIIGSTLQ